MDAYYPPKWVIIARRFTIKYDTTNIFVPFEQEREKTASTNRGFKDADLILTKIWQLADNFIDNKFICIERSVTFALCIAQLRNPNKG